MRRFLPIFLVVLLALAACGGSKDTGTDNNAPVEATVQVLPDPGPSVGKYDPKDVSVTVGKAIKWDFKDAANPHSVTADDNSFDSQLLESGKSWTHTFTKAGTFKYHCSIHAQMVGTITVK